VGSATGSEPRNVNERQVRRAELMGPLMSTDWRGECGRQGVWGRRLTQETLMATHSMGVHQVSKSCERCLAKPATLQTASCAQGSGGRTGGEATAHGEITMQLLLPRSSTPKRAKAHQRAPQRTKAHQRTPKRSTCNECGKSRTPNSHIILIPQHSNILRMLLRVREAARARLTICSPMSPRAVQRQAAWWLCCCKRVVRELCDSFYMRIM